MTHRPRYPAHYGSGGPVVLLLSVLSATLTRHHRCLSMGMKMLLIQLLGAVMQMLRLRKIWRLSVRAEKVLKVQAKTKRRLRFSEQVAYKLAVVREESDATHWTIYNLLERVLYCH